uniref:Uncharacterized protein n=1 Tax=Micrurus lemniscatus lemniscatus TaxID=129467 RepID=A0A2D4HWM5_MICLE
MVQRQWVQPGTYPNPSESDKRYYNVVTDLTEVLQLPMVDGPLTALTSSTFLSQDTVDTLKTEDRRAELTLHRAHQVVAWAVKATTTASFFNRVSLLWLRQMQARAPCDDQRFHQDINKVIFG